MRLINYFDFYLLYFEAIIDRKKNLVYMKAVFSVVKINGTVPKNHRWTDGF